MSLILDALNRARQERGDEGPAALPAGPLETPGVRPLVPVLAAALALAVAVISWLAWELWLSPGAGPAAAEGAGVPSPGAAPPPRPVDAASSDAASSVGAAPPPRQGAATSDGSRREGAPPTTASPTRAASPGPAVAALYAAAPADAAAPRAAPRESAPQESTRGEPVRETTAGSQTTSAEETIDIEEVLARARQEMGEPALAPHPAPLLADLSQQQKDAIPTLMYLRHDYVENGVSSVLINGETRRVGDRIGAVQVEEILRDAVVLRHRDTLFRLRALNSWVNL